MIINYDDLVNARELIVRDIQAQFFGVPLSSEHYILVEHRVQTLILAGLLGEDSNKKLSEGIDARLQPHEG